MQARGLSASFYFLSITAMIERFAVYASVYYLLLLLTKQYGFSYNDGFKLYGAFASLMFALPIIGGIISDKYIGYQYSLLLGLLFMGAGYLLLAVMPTCLTFALSLLIVGNGLYKPSSTSLLGTYYLPGDSRHYISFSIYYGLMNIGTLLSTMLFGLIWKLFGYTVACYVSGIVSMFGAILSLAVWQQLKGENYSFTQHYAILATVMIVVVAIIIHFVLSNLFILDILYVLLVLIVIFFLAKNYLQATYQDKKHYSYIFLLLLLLFIFLTEYFSTLFSVTPYLDQLLKSTAIAHVISAGQILALDPLFVMVLTPLLIVFHKKMLKKAVIYPLILSLLLAFSCYHLLIFSYMRLVYWLIISFLVSVFLCSFFCAHWPNCWCWYRDYQPLIVLRRKIKSDL